MFTCTIPVSYTHLGAGSLVAYSIGITDIDPIKYGLIFERFLNPERISMPDFDVDFCYEKRDKVIEYVCKKYGYDNVSQIITSVSYTHLDVYKRQLLYIQM